MEQLLFSINIVLPLFLLMSAGYFSRCLKLVDDHTAKVMNNLIFRVFLPVLLCNNIMNADKNIKGTGKVFLFLGIAILLVFLLLFLIMPLIEKDRKKIGAMIQGIGRGNYALFGLPLVAALFPGVDVSLASLLIALLVPLYNILSVITFAIFCDSKPSKKDMLLTIITNPQVVGIVIGFLFLQLNLSLPAFIESAMVDLSKVASPLALFVLGSTIRFSKLGENIRQLIFVVVARLVVFPSVILAIAILLGFRRIELACLLIAFAAPTAVNSYSMAQIMGGDDKLAAEQIVMTTACSIPTMFLFVLIFTNLGLFA